MTWIHDSVKRIFGKLKKICHGMTVEFRVIPEKGARFYASVSIVCYTLSWQKFFFIETKRIRDLGGDLNQKLVVDSSILGFQIKTIMGQTLSK